MIRQKTESGILIAIFRKKKAKIDLKDYRPITNIPIETIDLENIETHYEDRVLEPIFHKKITWNGKLLLTRKRNFSKSFRKR